jgi:hypothetical protein
MHYGVLSDRASARLLFFSSPAEDPLWSYGSPPYPTIRDTIRPYGGQTGGRLHFPADHLLIVLHHTL